MGRIDKRPSNNGSTDDLFFSFGWRDCSQRKTRCKRCMPADCRKGEWSRRPYFETHGESSSERGVTTCPWYSDRRTAVAKNKSRTKLYTIHTSRGTAFLSGRQTTNNDDHGHVAMSRFRSVDVGNTLFGKVKLDPACIACDRPFGPASQASLPTVSTKHAIKRHRRCSYVVRGQCIVEKDSRPTCAAKRFLSPPSF